MPQANALLGLYTQTPLHAGAGSATGVIDLPIQREAHTGWPCVYGSGVKGALRADAFTKTTDGDNDDLLAVFGPETKNADEHAGALLVGDARLLLLPVRSLTSHFKWVSCPEALRRLKDDARRLGLAEPFDFELPDHPNEDQAWTPTDGPGDLFLEEYRLQTAKRDDLGALITALAALMERPDAQDALKRQLVIVSDDRFGELAASATPVAAHVRLESGTKTVAPGALWYEETIAPDTLFTVALSAVRSRKQGRDLSAEEVLAKVLDQFPVERPWLQIGGNETVGMGWCAVSARRTVKAEG